MKRQIDGQLSFLDTVERVPDTIIVGNKPAIAKHPDHKILAMRRPFISWDGEGYTDEFGFHHYWLLANSVGDKAIAAPGQSLSRSTIGRLFYNSRARYPYAIDTGFALGYDFTMMLRSNGLEQAQVDMFKEKNHIVVDGYVWRFLMGKQLSIWEEGNGNKGDKFNLQDSWGYFQRSFINALNEYFPNGWPYRDVITEMKAKRANFTRDEDEAVMQYNDMELELHVMLMEELRDRLYNAGMPIQRWYGPGALANGLMRQWKIKEKQVDLYVENPNLAAIAQIGYAGGRFELLKPGHINGKVYQYDINSAYPYAIAKLPNLARGKWYRLDYPNLEDLTEFSIARIRWNTNCGKDDRDYGSGSITEVYPESIPFPLYRRIPNGSIHYPSHGIHGWYWTPEIVAAINYGLSLPQHYGFEYQIEEAYCFVPDDDEKPFEIVHQLYRNRQKLKKLNNGAHIGIKLGLNSLYGKLAQQVGWKDSRQIKPPYHNLAMAGYVTAVCRAKMVEASMQSPESIIAYETDGIFSTTPLDLPVSSELGDWELTEWDDMWYFQSGFRFGFKDGEIIKPATRGIPIASLQFERVREQVVDALSVVEVEQNQFTSISWAYHMNRPDLAGQWRHLTKKLHLMCEDPRAKRIHEPDCYECEVNEDEIREYRWFNPHYTLPRRGYEHQMSEPHKVLWSKTGKSDPDIVDLIGDEILEP